MIRVINECTGTCLGGSDAPALYIEGFCLSTDTKPTDGLATGSRLTEVDTGKVYLFDEEADSGSKWIEQGAANEPEPADGDT
jgi:hypothetical protein